jgi:prevent-host-death family protein
MPIYGVGELNQQGSKILAQLEEDGEPVVITKQGRPIAVLSALEGEQVRDLTLSLAPAFVERRRRAEEDLRAGRTRSVSEAREELERELEETEEGRAFLAKHRGGQSELHQETLAESGVPAASQAVLKDESSEVISEVEELFADAPTRLADRSTTVVGAWSADARRLIDRAIGRAWELVDQYDQGRAESAPRAKAGSKDED